MRKEYVLWISVEECEVDGDDYGCIESVGEPRQAGCFETERMAFEQVERLLTHARAVKGDPQA